MKNKILKSMVKALAVSLSCLIASANAGQITLNHINTITPLVLSESFTAFYRYGSPDRSSANTGYEQEATAIMFLAEYSEELALFTLLDAKGGSRETRRADMTISNFSLSDVLLVDDGGESNSKGFHWRWFNCCTDGMIYRIKHKDSFELDIAFSKVVGLGQYKFLSFTDEFTPPEELAVDATFSIQSKVQSKVPNQLASVPEPSTLMILACGVIGVALVRRKKQS